MSATSFRPAFTTYQIRDPFRRGAAAARNDVADIQGLYGHTRPETTMIYAPPEFAKHRAALERLRRSDATRHAVPDWPAPLADAAGHVQISAGLQGLRKGVSGRRSDVP